jgi:hypothetical protein
MSKSAPRGELKPWDPRPWPKRGDDSIEVLYAAAARALSQWEFYEGALSLLFSAFVSTGLTQAARRAYRAVRTFEGRRDMLRAAAAAYFAEMPDSDLLARFNEILQNATNFAPRRADIAHAVVDHFISYPGSALSEDATYCLYPSGASAEEGNHNNRPSYCFSSVELDYFFLEFYQLQEPAASVAVRIIKRDRRHIGRQTPCRTKASNCAGTVADERGH